MKSFWRFLLILLLALLLALSLVIIEKETSVFSKGAAALSGSRPAASVSSSSAAVSHSSSVSSGGEGSQATAHDAALLPVDASGQLAKENPVRTPENTGENESFPADFYPYRTMLSEKGKKVYNQVFANAQALNDSFYLVSSLPPDELETVFSAVLFDHPELFWLDSSYQYEYTAQGEAVSMTLSFNSTADHIAAAQAKFDAALKALIDGAGALATAVEREQYVHDYLLDQVEYDLDSALNQSAYSALVNGRSVCAGYSRAFQLAMTRLGVPCYYCVGDSGGSHAWNMIRLDTGYYHIDVSWDDPVGNPSGTRHYQYFNLTDAEISVDHTRTRLSQYLPACDGPSLLQQAPSGLETYAGLGFTEADILYSLDDYYAACRKALNREGLGEHTFFFLLSDQFLLDDVYTSVKKEDYAAGYLNDVMADLELNGCSYQLQIKAQELDNGYYRLTQKVVLEEAVEKRSE
ncbi:MAG: transglutaminase domain-containing protein [Oscillospiraceae bacterium]|nr:transglutaminase domain-containing protein [Oscillospiraceae bacterium]